MSIQTQFGRVIIDVFPSADGKRCDLTFKRRKAYEKMFFLGYKACLTTVMRSTELPEDKAHDLMEDLFNELDAYLPNPAVAIKAAEEIAAKKNADTVPQ